MTSPRPISRLVGLGLAVALVTLTGCTAGIPSQTAAAGALLAAKTTPTTGGTLAVRFPNLRPRMHTQATIGDVYRLTLTYSSPLLDEPLVQEVTPEQLAVGTSSASFGGLPVGDGTLTIQVYDQYDDLIGSQEAPVTIVGATTTPVALNVALDPNAGPGTVTVTMATFGADKLPVPTGAYAQVAFYSTRLAEPILRTVAPQDLANGLTSESYPDMPAGTASVAVTVYDQYDTVIGQAQTTFVVVSGTTMPVDLSVPLTPNADTGDLSATVTFTDGVPTAPPVWM